MKGPAPTPTALKKLRGNPGKRPLNEAEPTPELATPSVPSHLSKEARREWRRIVPELEKLGLLTKLDRTALAAYCDAVGRWVQASRELEEHGLTTVTPNGYPIQSPWLAISNKALAQLRQFIQEFGLSPASRSRVSATPPADDEGGFF
jgi:P27 family predicted phage terminase small subunit